MTMLAMFPSSSPRGYMEKAQKELTFLLTVNVSKKSTRLTNAKFRHSEATEAQCSAQRSVRALKTLSKSELQSKLANEWLKATGEALAAAEKWVAQF